MGTNLENRAAAAAGGPVGARYSLGMGQRLVASLLSLARGRWKGATISEAVRCHLSGTPVRLIPEFVPREPVVRSKLTRPRMAAALSFFSCSYSHGAKTNRQVTFRAASFFFFSSRPGPLNRLGRDY